ncbi:hypothetical protein C8Q74DRAFT_508393 [Fomes fomentarius]|nr:hypothetical protein C8Q74DRAFT_508393 [Fomes fomentarius]
MQTSSAARATIQAGLESRAAPRYGRSSPPTGVVVPGAGLYVALGTSTCICGEANVRRNGFGSLRCTSNLVYSVR